MARMKWPISGSDWAPIESRTPAEDTNVSDITEDDIVIDTDTIVFKPLPHFLLFQTQRLAGVEAEDENEDKEDGEFQSRPPPNSSKRRGRPKKRPGNKKPSNAPGQTRGRPRQHPYDQKPSTKVLGRGRARPRQGTAEGPPTPSSFGQPDTTGGDIVVSASHQSSSTPEPVDLKSNPASSKPTDVASYTRKYAAYLAAPLAHIPGEATLPIDKEKYQYSPRLTSTGRDRMCDGQQAKLVPGHVQLLPSKFNPDHPLLNLRLELEHSEDLESCPASNTTLWTASFERYGVPLGHIFSSGLLAHVNTFLNPDEPVKVFLPRFAYLLSKVLVHPIFRGDILCLRCVLQYVVHLRITKSVLSGPGSLPVKEVSTDDMRLAKEGDIMDLMARLEVAVSARVFLNDAPRTMGWASWGQFLLQECDVQLLLQTLDNFSDRFLAVDEYFSNWMEKANKVRTQMESSLGELLTIWSLDINSMISKTPGQLGAPHLFLESSRHNLTGMNKPESDEQSSISAVQGLMEKGEPSKAESVVNDQAENYLARPAVSLTASTEAVKIQTRALRPRMSRAAKAVAPKIETITAPRFRIDKSRSRGSNAEGRGPVRRARGTKKSNYENIHSDPRLPPSRGGRQHLRSTLTSATADLEAEENGESDFAEDPSQQIPVPRRGPGSRSLAAAFPVIALPRQPDGSGQGADKWSTMSCRRCRRLHLGCDKSHPTCSRCAKTSEDCTYPDGAKLSDHGTSTQQVAQSFTPVSMGQCTTPVTGTEAHKRPPPKLGTRIEPQDQRVQRESMGNLHVEESIGIASLTTPTTPTNEVGFEDHDGQVSFNTSTATGNSQAVEQRDANLGLYYEDAGNGKTMDDLEDLPATNEDFAKSQDLNNNMLGDSSDRSYETNDLELAVLEDGDDDAEESHRSRSSSIASFTFVSSPVADEFRTRSIPSHWYGDFPRRGLPREDRKH